MNCQTCGTKLTEFNATSFRHVHDVGNCAQVLLAQRDEARAEIHDLKAKLAQHHDGAPIEEPARLLTSEDFARLCRCRSGCNCIWQKAATAIETAELRGRIAGLRQGLIEYGLAGYAEVARLEAELKKLGGEAEAGRCPLCKLGVVMDDVHGKRCSLRYSSQHQCLWESSMVIGAYRDPK